MDGLQPSAASCVGTKGQGEDECTGSGLVKPDEGPTRAATAGARSKLKLQRGGGAGGGGEGMTQRSSHGAGLNPPSGFSAKDCECPR
jgi:hypothetical protein